VVVATCVVDYVTAQDGTIRLWDADTGQPRVEIMRRLDAGLNRPKSVASSAAADGR